MNSSSEFGRPGDPYKGRGKIVAVVSGKGGSGKTMIAVALAQGAAIAGERVVLVDADFATGGLTYYLTFREFTNARMGLSDLIGDHFERKPLPEWASIGTIEGLENEWVSRVRLVPIGDQRRLRDNLELEYINVFHEILEEAAGLGSIVIVDCRGGIDRQSLAVCGMADEILVVVETDTTSIRASQHLADVLSNERLNPKIVGFVLNKVMDDPTSIAKTVGSLLGISYLGSIPFDIEATRSYIQGRIPYEGTLFCRHVFATLPRIAPNMYQYEKRAGLLSPEEFGTVTLRSPEVRFGGLVILIVAAYVSFGYAYLVYSSSSYRFYLPQYTDIAVLSLVMSLLFAAVSDPIKQSIGRIVRVYGSFNARLFGRRSRRR